MISDETIRELLDAARLAPSGCNAQPWRFYVVACTETMKELREKRAFKQKFVYKAPLVLVCCGDPKAYRGKYGGEYQVKDGSVPENTADRKKMFAMVEGKEIMRSIRDVSIASAFLVLRATELDLGTTYVGLINEAVLKEALGIPEEFVIPFVITAGYYTEKAVPKQVNTLGEIVIGGTLIDE
jgi:nitroreductase